MYIQVSDQWKRVCLHAEGDSEPTFLSRNLDRNGGGERMESTTRFFLLENPTLLFNPLGHAYVGCACCFVISSPAPLLFVRRWEMNRSMSGRSDIPGRVGGGQERDEGAEKGAQRTFSHSILEGSEARDPCTLQKTRRGQK